MDDLTENDRQKLAKWFESGGYYVFDPKDEVDYDDDGIILADNLARPSGNDVYDLILDRSTKT